MQALECLLFVRGDEGITITEISDLLDIDDNKANDLINLLVEKYNGAFGFGIEKYGAFYKFVTKKEYHEYIEKLVEIDNSNSLTEASLETLAIVAYNEPITRVKVDEIRGVNSSHMIRKLINCGLIKEVGKSDLPGRPNLYGVTSKFLDYFGIKSLEDLPKLCEIEINETLDVDLFESKFKEIEENSI